MALWLTLSWGLKLSFTMHHFIFDATQLKERSIIYWLLALISQILPQIYAKILLFMLHHIVVETASTSCNHFILMPHTSNKDPSGMDGWHLIFGVENRCFVWLIVYWLTQILPQIMVIHGSMRDARYNYIYHISSSKSQAKSLCYDCLHNQNMLVFHAIIFLCIWDESKITLLAMVLGSALITAAK